MKYDFDKKVLRRNTGCAKWDLGDEDVIPMWVADMDFEAPQPVIDAVKKRAAHGIYGYSFLQEPYYEAVINWMNKRHGWKTEKEWITFSPGVVPAVNMLVRALTQAGDNVIVQSPVYYPFYKAITNNGCQVVQSPLLYEKGRYYMNFDDLENKMKDDRTKLLILCSPHNPVGRVWTREELTKLGNLCLKYDVFVISDEIHSDLIYSGNKHIPFASLSEKFALNSAVCTAPSKTFNIAGLQISNIIIPDEKIRKLYKNVIESNGINDPNVFGIEACEAAYRGGEEWLDELLCYIEENRDYVINYIGNHIPEIKVVKPEGTYLIWLDCTKLKMKSQKLHEFFMKKAKVWFDEGYIFGTGGENFERMNIACPRATIEQALKRIEQAIKTLS